MLIHTSSFWSGLLELAGHVRPFHCYAAVCLPNARVLRSLGAPLAFERFSFVFLGSGRHQLGPAFAFPDRLNPLGADWFRSCDGLPVSFGTACALYGLRRKENAPRFRTIQVSLRTCHSVGGKTLREVELAARSIGLQIQVFNANTSHVGS